MIRQRRQNLIDTFERFDVNFEVKGAHSTHLQARARAQHTQNRAHTRMHATIHGLAYAASGVMERVAVFSGVYACVLAFKSVCCDRVQCIHVQGELDTTDAKTMERMRRYIRRVYVEAAELVPERILYDLDGNGRVSMDEFLKVRRR